MLSGIGQPDWGWHFASNSLRSLFIGFGLVFIM